MDETNFGQLLERVMADQRVTNVTLADRIHVDSSLISKYRRGAAQPSRERLGDIVRGMGLDQAAAAALYQAMGFMPPEPALDDKARTSKVEERDLAGARRTQKTAPPLSEQFSSYLNYRGVKFGRSAVAFYLSFPGLAVVANVIDDGWRMTVLSSLPYAYHPTTEPIVRLSTLETLVYFNSSSYAVASVDPSDGEITVESSVRFGSSVLVPDAFFDRAIGAVVAGCRELAVALGLVLFGGADAQPALEAARGAGGPLAGGQLAGVLPSRHTSSPEPAKGESTTSTAVDNSAADPGVDEA
jgi:transcriptional regulator with XRE-family HTH domain